MDPIVKLLGDWSNNVSNIWCIILRIGIAVILGAIIGWERATKRHAAGLRTFILVTLAGTVAMMLDKYIGSTIYIISGITVIASAIISSNSTLYTSRSQIKGLTTSAGLWISSIVGLTLGAGYYTVTLIIYLILLFSLSLFPKLERYLKNKSNHFEIHLELKNAKYLQDFSTTIRELGIRIDDIEANPAYLNSGLSVYTISLSVKSDELKKYKTHAEIIEALKSLEYISHIEEIQ